jgi:hypothetical protein
MSTRFDEIMLRGVKEKFLVKGVTIDDLPADSNEIGKVKTDSKSKMM